MSTLKADAVTTKSDNTDLVVTGGGSGVPDIEAGFKVGGSAGVPTASIRDDAVTLAKLAAGTDGELITWDASGDPAAVAVGTATHVLTSNGAGAAPTFQAAGGGAWAVLTSGTLSGASALAITGITKTIKIFLSLDVTSDATTINLRTSTDGGSTYDSTSGDYGGLSVYGLDNANAISGSSLSSTSLRFENNYGVGNAAGEMTIFEVTIIDPQNASNYTGVLWAGQGVNSIGVGIFAYGSGMRKAAENVDAVQIYPAAGTFSGPYVVVELN